VRLLLDTHIWLWTLIDPSKLKPRVSEAISDPSSELWLSPLSVWETLVLCEKRRLSLEPDARTWLDCQMATALFRDAPVTWPVAIESRRVAVVHEDPVDRFLAATARVYDLTLVTADERLLRAPGYAVLANR